MTEPGTPDPTPDPTPAPQGLTETELKNIVGGEIDARMKDRVTPEHLTTLRTDILGEVGKLFEANKPQNPADEASLLKSIETLPDGKLKGIGVSGPRRGPLSRWLGI
jgi:hypothetical protein